MKSRQIIASTAAAGTLTAGVTGCGHTPPPRRPRALAGPQWQAEFACMRAHPVQVSSGMLAGILVASSGPGYACLGGWCRTWQGTVVVQGGYVGQLSSGQGDDGMASLASRDDEIEFPSANVALDAPSEDGTAPPASVIVSGAVHV